MRSRHWFFLVGILLYLGGIAFVIAGARAARRVAPAEAAAATVTPVATVKQIMKGIVGPAATAVFNSVSTTVTSKGIEEKAPQTDEEWAAVRAHALVLLEAPNLLTMEGRKVAAHGEKSKFPEVELQPEQIQKLIDDDRPSFIRRARRLQDAATSALTAVQAKDKGALFKAIESVDRACENCHLHYWYPNDARAVQAAKETGVLD